MTRISRYQLFQQRTGWPFGPWKTALITLFAIGCANLAVIAGFEFMMIQGVQ